MPLFLTVTLGAPVAAVGLIEGVAEGIAVGLRGAAGWLSDRWGERRLPWIGGGYGGSAMGRILVAAAPHWHRSSADEATTAGVQEVARIFGQSCRTQLRKAASKSA